MWRRVGLVLGAAAFTISCSAPTERANQPATTATAAAATTPAAATAAPTPTPTPRSAFKVGETVTYQDGWKVTVTKFEEQSPARFSTPKPGMRFVAVILKFENGSTKPVSPNPFYFKLQDGTGVRRSASFFTDRSDSLSSSELAPGAMVVGSMVFEAPVGDAKLQLIYEHIGYRQTTFELF